MKVRLKLNPGQPGTRQFKDRYGEQLVCVRYRYDERTARRYTTVELIVDQKEWLPPSSPGPDPDEILLLRVDYAETDLRTRIHQAGGHWSKSRKLWKLPRKNRSCHGAATENRGSVG